MATDRSEMLGSVIQTSTIGNQRPDLQLVPPIEEEVTSPVSIDLDGYVEGLERALANVNNNDDPTLIFFDGVLSRVPSYIADLLSSMTRSKDPEVLRLAIYAVPNILQRASKTKDLLPDEELDKLRDAWGSLMAHEDEDIRYEAQEVFDEQVSNLQTRDPVTYSRIGWLATPAIFQ